MMSMYELFHSMHCVLETIIRFSHLQGIGVNSASILYYELQ